LILGGAKSGKSRYALSLAGQYASPRLFVATATAGDAEMAARIERHRQERGPQWDTRETPLAVAEAIAASPGRYGVILVDCLTLWLSNLLLEEKSESELARDCQGLVEAVTRTGTPIILVSNEVGGGIVPDNPLARKFRDQAGRLHQDLARVADLVTLVVAGLPMALKGQP
jgi:adenosylcobinamide kinase/adenosylcobinamide-phosphate guanylyltransferase